MYLCRLCEQSQFQERQPASVPAPIIDLVLLHTATESNTTAYYGLIASESERELMDQLADAGVDQAEMFDLMIALNKAGTLKGDEKKEAYRNALAEASLTDEEKTIIVGRMLGTDMTTESGSPSRYANFLTATSTGLSVDRYMDLYSAGADMEDYLTMTDAGIDPEAAADLALELCKLEPEDGADNVSKQQRCRVIVDSDLSESEQLSALSTVMAASELSKLEAGCTFGLTPKAYVELKDFLPQYDADGNGSYTQAETEAAIDALSGGEQNLLLVLMGDAREGLSLTRTQKAVLWQIQNKSWKPAKNPYDTKVGQQVYDALHDEESTDAAEDDDLLRQLLGIG